MSCTTQWAVMYSTSMRCVNVGGRLLTIGFTSGRWPWAAVNLILIKQLSVIGVRAGNTGGLTRSRAKKTVTVYAMAEAGEIDPYISHALPLAQAVDAMRLLENREVIGKAVVTMNGYEAG